MRDPFSNYDAWLERPYQDAIEASDAFVDWAEENDYNLDDPVEAAQAEVDYEEYLASLADYEYDEYYDDWDEDEIEEREYYGEDNDIY